MGKGDLVFSCRPTLLTNDLSKHLIAGLSPKRLYGVNGFCEDPRHERRQAH